MNYLAFIALSLSLAASSSADFPVFRLTGQFSGLDGPSQRRVDLRVLFFAGRTGGRPIGEQRIQSVDLDRGRFSVALDLSGLPRHLKTRRVYVEIGLRPAGRRYAAYKRAGPRRILRLNAAPPYQVWRLERLPTPGPGRGSSKPVSPARTASETPVRSKTPLHQGDSRCRFFSSAC